MSDEYVARCFTLFHGDETRYARKYTNEAKAATTKYKTEGQDECPICPTTIREYLSRWSGKSPRANETADVHRTIPFLLLYSSLLFSTLLFSGFSLFLVAPSPFS